MIESKIPQSAALAAVLTRMKRVYRGWGRDTSVAQMRRDWDDLFWSDAMSAIVEPVKAGGVAAAWIAAPGARRGKAVIYFHGGGFRIGSLRSHRDLMARISVASGYPVLGVDYRMVPEHPYPAAHDDALTVWHWLRDKGVPARNVALAGDSAGGGLALSTALAIRDAGHPMPAAVVTLSAWTDLTARRESYTTRAQIDPLHQREMILAVARRYLGPEGNTSQPRVSPLFADLAGLPPLLMQVGDRETVLDDTRDFAEKARRAEVDVTLDMVAGMIHVFQQFPEELPEARAAIGRIGDFLRRHLDCTATVDATPTEHDGDAGVFDRGGGIVG